MGIIASCHWAHSQRCCRRVSGVKTERLLLRRVLGGSYRALWMANSGSGDDRATVISLHEEPLPAANEERVTCGWSPTRPSRRHGFLSSAADEPSIVSHENGAEISVLTLHRATDGREVATTASTTTHKVSQYFRRPSAQGMTCQVGVERIAGGMCPISSAFITISEMCTTAVSSTSCALNHFG